MNIEFDDMSGAAAWIHVEVQGLRFLHGYFDENTWQLSEDDRESLSGALLHFEAALDRIDAIAQDLERRALAVERGKPETREAAA